MSLSVKDAAILRAIRSSLSDLLKTQDEVLQDLDSEIADAHAMSDEIARAARLRELVSQHDIAAERCIALSKAYHACFDALWAENLV